MNQEHQAQILRIENELQFIENCIECPTDDMDLINLNNRLLDLGTLLEKLVRKERIEKLGLKLIIT